MKSVKVVCFKKCGSEQREKNVKTCSFLTCWVEEFQRVSSVEVSIVKCEGKQFLKVFFCIMR